MNVGGVFWTSSLPAAPVSCKATVMAVVDSVIPKRRFVFASFWAVKHTLLEYTRHGPRNCSRAASDFLPSEAAPKRAPRSNVPSGRQRRASWRCSGPRGNGMARNEDEDASLISSWQGAVCFCRLTLAIHEGGSIPKRETYLSSFVKIGSVVWVSS